jgi:hypothetical protein
VISLHPVASVVLQCNEAHLLQCPLPIGEDLTCNGSSGETQRCISLLQPQVGGGRSVTASFGADVLHPLTGCNAQSTTQPTQEDRHV